MARSPDKKILTKKHLARIERENIQRRYIMIVLGVVIVAVVGLITYGLLEQSVIQPIQPVAVVAGDRISTREFASQVRYQRSQMVNQYLNTYQTMQLFGEDPNTQSFFIQNLRQIYFQLDTQTMGQQVLNNLIEDRLIRQEAARRGITVTTEEVDKAIEEAMQFYPAGAAPTPTEVPTTAPTSTLSPLQLTLAPPTATPTITPSPEPTITPTATLEITATATVTATATMTATAGPTAVPSPSPTPTPYTREAFEKNYKDILTNLDQSVQYSEKDLRYFFESQLYREKVLDAMTKDLARTQDQVWARHILVADETIATAVKTRLEAGEDFASLAAELSTDQSNAKRGGDLGWFPTGQMDPEFEKVSFNLGIGAVSGPVKSQFGWHIIQVLGHEERPLTSTEYDSLRQTKFTEWLAQQRLAENVKTYDYWTERVPSEPTIPENALAILSEPQAPVQQTLP